MTHGVFLSPQTFAPLPLSRLNNRFLTPAYNHPFCCDFLRNGLDAEVFHQRPIESCTICSLNSYLRLPQWAARIAWFQLRASNEHRPNFTF